MKILPPSQINNLSIMEDVLEELRLNVVDHIQDIASALDLYSLTSIDLKRKLNLLGLSSINIGKFITLDINSDEFEFISPEFYKMYRKLNQHRGNKMSMDYVFHSAGMMNTLVHSNTQFYAQDDIFGDVASFFEFDTYRDNQFPEIGIGDGYIVVPYSSNRSQTLKSYLATNPIIFTFLPAGYTFIFLSEYRNGYSTGVLQYDNFLNPKDPVYTGDPDEPDLDTNPYPEYWEVPHIEYVEEVLIKEDESEFSYTHTLYYYDPFLWRDTGYGYFIKHYPRYTSDDLSWTPLYLDGIQFHNIQDYLTAYGLLLDEEVYQKWLEGYESDLNNTLFYKDVWLGDYLVSYLMGGNWYPEDYDHVKGLKSIQAPTYSYASLYNRGESLASQYFQREEKVISTADELIQEHKREIISDRREVDLFKFRFTDEYSLWIVLSTNDSYTSNLIMSVISGLDPNTVNYIVQNAPHVILDGLDYTQAEAYFYQLIQDLTTATIFEVRDSEGNVVLTNADMHTITVESTSDNQIDGNTASMQVVNTSATISSGTETLYQGSTSISMDYIEFGD